MGCLGGGLLGGLEAILGHLEAILGRLEAMLGRLEAILGRLGAILASGMRICCILRGIVASGERLPYFTRDGGPGNANL